MIASTRISRTRYFAWLLVLASIGCRPDKDTGKDARPSFSSVKSDERIVFFDTAARLDSSAGEWVVPVHGWIHEPEDSTFRKGAIAKALSSKYGLKVSDATRANFDRRVNLLLVDNERGKRIGVRVGSTTQAMPESEANGHITGSMQLAPAVVETHAAQERLTLRAVARGLDDRVFTGTVHLIPPTGVSVISDIDDTVKISNVRDHARLFENTFFKDFQPVPGMPALYRAWAAKGARFHFVSSSPWHLYEPLKEFMADTGFPPATFSLKRVRLTDETLMNIFKKGTETKPLQIKPLLQAFPGRQFVLVGDSGEQDPEVYAALALAYPEQIVRIYIRNVTGATATDARFRDLFAGIAPERWALFTDPATLELPPRKGAP